MLMRAIRNYKLFKAQRLSQMGEYARATLIIDKLLERHPNAIVFNLLAADTKLYSGDLPAALEQFHFVKQLIDRQEDNGRKQALPGGLYELQNQGHYPEDWKQTIPKGI